MILDEEKDNYSIWIVPEGEAKANLQSHINTLAQEVNTPRFVPHVTVAAGIEASPDDLRNVFERVENLAEGLGRFSVALSGIGMLNEEHRSLFLHADSYILDSIYRKAKDLFPDAEVEKFRDLPHLSLIYGMLPTITKNELIESHPIDNLEFSVEALKLYRTNHDEATWQLVRSFPDKFVSLSAVGELLKVSDTKIRNLVTEGTLSSIRTAGGHRRISLEDTKDLLRNPQYSIPEAGEYLGISKYTIARCIKAGKLKHTLSKKGHFRVRKSDLDTLIR
jgi:excisionase family DNA binding protein